MICNLMEIHSTKHRFLQMTFLSRLAINFIIKGHTVIISPDGPGAG